MIEHGLHDAQHCAFLEVVVGVVVDDISVLEGSVEFKTAEPLPPLPVSAFVPVRDRFRARTTG